MAPKPEDIVADIGKQLAQHARPTKDFLLKSLRQAASALSELDQLSTLKPYMKPLSQSLAKHGMLHHKDKDVKLLVAICFCEIIRILAPNPSFDDKTSKGVFELFISLFMELGDTVNPFFPRKVKILETVASLEYCRAMLDLDCDDLILKMFRTFFSVVREEHQRSLSNGMLSIMSLILNEEENYQPLLEVVLHNLRKKGEGRASASYHLAVSLIQNCAEKIKPALCGFLTSCILDRESVRSDIKDFYHEIIFEIFQCAPHVLHAVIPNLTQELLTDQVDVRIKSVNLIGKLLALPKDHDIHEHHYLFTELLKRFSDKSADVRISAIRAVKSCYMADPSGTESHNILSSLEGRLLDFDASVRAETVAVVCELARFNLKNFPESLIACATDRLRDKMTSVRKEALRKLMEVYREYCTKCYEGQMMLNNCYEQIPCKILMLSCDKNLKEFRPQNLELLLASELFSSSLPVEDRTRHWIHLYSLFTPVHVKALNLVLCQKRRFQKDMQGYLSLRRKEEGIDPEEADMRIKNAFKRMSLAFTNHVKAEESFHKLNQLKDCGIFDVLLLLLGEPEFSTSEVMRDKFLKKIRDKHLSIDFLETLSLKCSHSIFSAEHVHCIFDYVSSGRCGEGHLDRSSFSLLLDIIKNFPLLLRGSEHQLKMLILEEKFPLRGKLIQLLANIGPAISMELGEVYPVLESFCLEGTRAQSKAAISAIAALVDPNDQSLVVDLCQKLVESLCIGWNLPTVLQSLGCISEHFAMAFKKQENEVSSYIRKRIFEERMTEARSQFDEESASDISFNCQLKIYGLKTLVKSALPKTEVREKELINNLLEILSKALLTGEIFEGTTTCENDRAHIRLAAAKSVLRLSKRWDPQISPKIFQSTVTLAKDASDFVCKVFLDKTHKLLKEHAVSNRFACAFALATSNSVKDLQDTSLRYLVEFIKEYGHGGPSCRASDTEGSLTDIPAYMLVFLLHVLAHDARFPIMNSHSEEHFTQFFRPLVLMLQMLINPQFFYKDIIPAPEASLYVRNIFRAIKLTEDAVDPVKTPNLHMLADIGISILNILKDDDMDLSLAPDQVLLPSSLYKYTSVKKTKNTNCQSGFVVNENLVRKLVQICGLDFSQLSQKSIKHGPKYLKDSLHDRDTAGLSMSMLVDIRNLTTQKQIAEKESANSHMVEACPQHRQQTELIHSSPGTLPLQDDSPVIKEHDVDMSGNSESTALKEQQLDSNNTELGLFGTLSDVSTQGVDVSLSQQVERKRKSSSGSAERSEFSKAKIKNYCSSDGSTVSLLRQCDPIKVHMGDIKKSVAKSGVAGIKMQEKGVGKRKILRDRTNSLAVNKVQKHCQSEKSCHRPTIYFDSSASEVSDVGKDAIAHRTRRRKV